MSKRLLIETQLFTPTNITSRENSPNGNMVVEGILATAEIKNGNGRYYPRELWERELNTYKQLIKERRAVGELDHPETSVVNLKNVSHIVTDYWWDGDKVMGKMEILTTPSGNILSELIRNGVLVGVSSRGMGSIEQKGTMMEVQDDFSLVCWDFVSTPSNPGSYMTLVKEGLDFDEKSINKYSKVNSIITDILCSQTGNCPCPQC